MLKELVHVIMPENSKGFSSFSSMRLTKLHVGLVHFLISVVSQSFAAGKHLPGSLPLEYCDPVRAFSREAPAHIF